MSSIEDKIRKLKEMKEQSKLGGGKDRIEKQHESGKLTARERLEALLDTGTFVEIDPYVRHQSTNFGAEKNRPLGDAVVNRLGKNEWQTGLRLLPRLHGVRRIPW